MQSMLPPSRPETPIHQYNQNSSKKATDNTQKEATISQQSSQMSKKNNEKQQKEGETPQSLSILNNINFPSSLSVTLTNEQEENKKEQMRSCKQNIVNNNIEIIKIRDDLEQKSAFLAQNISSDKKLTNDDKEKQLLVVPSPPKNSQTKKDSQISGVKVSPNSTSFGTKPKESFQKAFLDSIKPNSRGELIPTNGQNARKRVMSPIKDLVEMKKPNMGDIKSKSQMTSDNIQSMSNKQQSPRSTNSPNSNSTKDSAYANAAMQHLMLSYAYPDLAQLQKSLMLETLRQNLALHQLQQHQKVHQQKIISPQDISPSVHKEKHYNSDKSDKK